MGKKSIPCCYVPSTVIFIDDNPNFLESIIADLPDTLASKVCENSRKALSFLNDVYKPDIISSKFINFPEEQFLDKASINIDTRKIHNAIYDPNRFNDISVVVIDYDMPGLDGLSFLKEMKHKSIKTVLLTGEADNEIAVDAFNKNLIDKFILKTNKGLVSKLIPVIEELKYAYYLDVSNYLTKTITVTGHSIKCLNDKRFVDLFKKICDEYHIVEFYLLDIHGSFLLLDINARLIWLIVKEKRELNNLYDVAEVRAHPNPRILEALRTGSKIPFFFSDTDFDTAPEDWDKYLHSATRLDGDNDQYYYTIIQGNGLYRVDTNAILPYKTFLKHRNRHIGSD